jgi:hypothetical protein
MSLTIVAASTISQVQALPVPAYGPHRYHDLMSFAFVHFGTAKAARFAWKRTPNLVVPASND